MDALAPMDVVVNCGVTEALPAGVSLRERGCKVFFAPGDTTLEEWDGRPQPVMSAVAFEHALDGIGALVRSSASRAGEPRRAREQDRA